MAHEEKNNEKRLGEKKQEILRTVLQLFLKKGYNATSTSDICSAAKLAKPTLYYYFGSKRNLLFSLHQDHLNKDLRPYLAKAQAIEDLEQRLYYMIKVYTTMICLHPELRFLIHETLGFRDKYFLQIKKEWKNHYILLRSTISGLQAAGKIDPVLKPSWAALFLIGMMTWITFWLDFRQKEQINQIAESAAAFASHALNLCVGQAPRLATRKK